MTVYGNQSRISVDVEGGGVGALSLGSPQKAVIFARGDPNSGSASTNDPTQVSGPGELAETFGADTPIVQHLRDTAANGVSYDLLWGVMPATQSVTGEQAGSGSGTLGNTPIIEDPDEITVTNTTQGQDETVVFRYESPPDTSNLADDEVAVNPFSGEVEAGDSDDYEVDYKYHDWQAAFDSATGIIQEQEVGSWAVDTEAESVLSTAIATATPLREDEWKMVRVEGLAEPNATATDGDAEIDTGAYSDNLDDDALFVAGPGRRLDSRERITGAIAGVMAGNSITDPIIGDTLTGIGDLEQTLTVPDQEDLEDAQLIPIADTGAPSIEGNRSPSTASDWLRTYFARRLADRLILAARAIGRATRGKLNSENTEQIVEQQLGDEIIDLIDQNVLRPNTDAEQRWYVTADQDPTNQRELDISFGFTPTGVVDVVDISATINY
jgi:hypothetical protein